MSRYVALLVALALFCAARTAGAHQRQKARPEQKQKQQPKAPRTKVTTGAPAAGALPRPQQQLTVTSSIKQHSGLARHASRLSGEQQIAADALVSQLRAGNTNPGIGTRHIFGRVHEARARNGARVYFRSSPGRIEIVGKSTKDNQEAVIRILRDLYPTTSSVEWRPAALRGLELAELAGEARIDAHDALQAA